MLLLCLFSKDEPEERISDMGLASVSSLVVLDLFSSGNKLGKIFHCPPYLLQMCLVYCELKLDNWLNARAKSPNKR